MRSPFLKTYVALALVAGLVAYVYFVESKKPANRDEKKKEKVVALDKAKAKELQITPAGGPALIVKKEGESWRMTEPMPVPADANEVDNVLRSLEGLEIDEVIADNATDLKQFGLDSPKTSLRVVADGKTQTLLLGDKTPDGNALYAKTPDKPRVFTIASYQETSLNKKPFDLRDRDLLKIKRDAVRALEISGPNESYALSRSEKGEWSFSKPIVTQAGRWSVDGLLGTLESLRMDSVASEDAKDLKPYGLSKPTRTVKLTLADGGYKILEIGSSPADKKYHAREASSSLVALIPNAVVDDLAKGMKELRAKRLADVATFDVEGVDIEADGKKTTLARSTTKDKDGVETNAWKKTAPEKKDLDRSKVEDALFKLSGLEVLEFLDRPQALPSYGLDAPVAKIRLRLAGGKPAVDLELGKKADAYYSRRPGDEAVLRLDSAKVDEALKALKEL